MNKLVIKVTYIIHKYTKYLKNQSFTLHYLQTTTVILVHVLPKIFHFNNTITCTQKYENEIIPTMLLSKLPYVIICL